MQTRPGVQLDRFLSGDVHQDDAGIGTVLPMTGPIANNMDPNPMIHVVAQVQVNDGQREMFLAEFRKLVPEVLRESGCLEYGPTIDAETDLDRQHTDASTVTIIEKWESLDHLKAHLAAPHMLAYRERVKEMVSGSKLHILQPA